jgi:voltage-gated potassium channel
MTPATVLARVRAWAAGLATSQSRRARIFETTMQTLIVASMAAFALGTLPDLPAPATATLEGFETLTVAVFTVEYLLRVLATHRPLRFVLSFYGLVDLLAIAPYYLAGGTDLRTLRALRLLRVLKLLRYGDAVALYARAFALIRRELIVFGLTALVVLYLAAVGIYWFEHAAQPQQFASVFHSLWWALVTLTTVGYGDAYPVTTGGRVFTSVVLVVGLGVVAVPSGLLASALVRARTGSQDT